MFFFSIAIADSYNLLGHTSQHINALIQLSLGYGSGMVHNDQQFLNMDQSLWISMFHTLGIVKENRVDIRYFMPVVSYSEIS